jgi:hypothetical protein
MEEISPWESDIHSANQEIPRLLWKQKVHYRAQKSPRLVSIMKRLNPVHTFAFFLSDFLIKIMSQFRVPTVVEAKGP